jgi:hypothetical protein
MLIYAISKPLDENALFSMFILIFYRNLHLN